MCYIVSLLASYFAAITCASTNRMAEKKRKAAESADSTKHKMKHSNKPKRQSKKLDGGGEKKKRKGPRLPNSLRKEIDRLNTNSLNGSDEDIDSDEARDFYEYEEPLPQEESRKNRRFDPVENYEYELPEKFEVCDNAIHLHELFLILAMFFGCFLLYYCG